MINGIKAYWWRPNIKGRVNFGDELNPYIMEYVSKKKITWSTPEEAELFGIGSILHFANREKKFLGGVSKSMLTLNEAIIDVKKG